MRELTVGLIGFGTLGREIAARLAAGAAGRVRLLALIRHPAAGADYSHLSRHVSRFEDLLAARPDLVVEAAGHGAIVDYGPRLLTAGIPVVIASIGALADDTLHARLQAAAREGGSHFTLPGGAIGGLDYIEAVRASPGLRIRYCSRKPPSAWRAELAARGIDAENLSGEVVLFEGGAREAGLLFPQNLNVAVRLALAGAGLDATEVRVVADPAAKGNTHEIEIVSETGRASLVFENSPSPTNPKTSALTALSLVRTVQMELMRIGAPQGTPAVRDARKAHRGI
jgi:aspartate dehydrogenase